jgi:hypothetical protein
MGDNSGGIDMSGILGLASKKKGRGKSGGGGGSSSGGGGSGGKGLIKDIQGLKSTPKPDSSQLVGEFKRGGKVRKTGLARVHAGERVLTKRQQRKAGLSRGRSRRKSR